MCGRSRLPTPGLAAQLSKIIYSARQRLLGYGAAASGLGLLPAAVAIGTVSLGLSARIAARSRQSAMLLAGLVLIAAGLALLTRLPAHASYPAAIQLVAAAMPVLIRDVLTGGRIRLQGLGGD